MGLLLTVLAKMGFLKMALRAHVYSASAMRLRQKKQALPVDNTPQARFDKPGATGYGQRLLMKTVAGEGLRTGQ